MTFSDVLFVWPGPRPPTPTQDELACTVGAWPTALGCAVTGWAGTPNKAQKEQIRAARVVLVNLFADSKHVTHIRAANPDAVIVAMPDPPLEYVLRDEHHNIWSQMAQADVITGRTESDCGVYGPLIGKRTVWLPSPIGPSDKFDELWDTPKEDVLIASEHNGIRAHSGATIAALAIVQREIGCDIHFYRANERTKKLADVAGLRVEWKDAVRYPEMCKATAAARWGIDLYPFHAQGRNLLTHAMVGTPVVGSNTNNPAGTYAVDPYCVEEAAQVVIRNWDWTYYEAARKHAREYTERTYGYEASRERVSSMLEEIDG